MRVPEGAVWCPSLAAERRHIMFILDPILMLAEALATFSETDDTANELKAAILLTARFDDAFADLDAPCGVTSLGSRPVPLPTERTHALLQAQMTIIERFGAVDDFSSGVSYGWMLILARLAQMGADASPQQRLDVLHLLASNAVAVQSETACTVQGSKPYQVTLIDGDYTNDGFTCGCKGYWSHGGGSLCKHVLAATCAVYAENQTSMLAV